MKKNKSVLIILVVAILALGGIGIGGYNSLVGKRTNVESQWATVESKLQRRHDLIPNLVNSVQGSMKQEKEVFGNIADARAKLAGAKGVGEVSEANTEMEGAISRLLVVMENYPELKSNENVNTLMTQLEGTENRISVERDRYNKEVKNYNVAIQRFPMSLLASMTGFEKEEFFEADEGAKTVPKVDLDTSK